MRIGFCILVWIALCGLAGCAGGPDGTGGPDDRGGPGRPGGRDGSGDRARPDSRVGRDGSGDTLDTGSAYLRLRDGLGLVPQATLSDLGDTVTVSQSDFLLNEDSPQAEAVHIRRLDSPFSAPERPSVFLLAPDSLRIRLLDRAAAEVVRETRDYYEAGQYLLYVDNSQLADGMYLVMIAGSRDSQVKRTYVMR